MFSFIHLLAAFRWRRVEIMPHAPPRRIKFVWPICVHLRFHFVGLKWRELISFVNYLPITGESMFAFVGASIECQLTSRSFFLFAPNIEINEWTLVYILPSRTQKRFFLSFRKQFTLSFRLFFVFGRSVQTMASINERRRYK